MYIIYDMLFFQAEFLHWAAINVESFSVFRSTDLSLLSPTSQDAA